MKPRPRGKDDPEQLQLDFARAEQLALIRDVRLPSVEGKTKAGKLAGNVNGLTMKCVLAMIDQFGRGREAWPSIERLAESCNTSTRTVKRAVAALESLSVLCVARRWNETAGAVLNHYRIVWSELNLLTPQRQANRPPTKVPESTDQSANYADQSARIDRPKCHHVTQSVGNGKEPPLTAAREAAEVVVVDDDWEQITEELRRLGVSGVRSAIREAKAGRLQPDDVLGAIEHFRSRPGAFGPGALAWWLRNAVPGQPPSEGWPEESRAYVAAAATIDRRGQSDEQRRQREAAERERSALQRRERELGPQLDSLDERGLAALAERVLEPGLLAWWRKRPADGTVREALLEALEREG